MRPRSFRYANDPTRGKTRKLDSTPSCGILSLLSVLQIKMMIWVAHQALPIQFDAQIHASVLNRFLLVRP